MNNETRAPKRRTPALRKRSSAHLWRRTARSRRGIAAMWVILATPAFLLMFCFVVDAGKIWLARVELESALESAALAGVKSWGDAGGGSTLASRLVAIDYAAANTVDGNSLAVASNYNPGNLPNQNNSPTGNFLFGSATPAGTDYIFDPTAIPDCNAGRRYAVRASATASVTSLCDGFLSLVLGPYDIHAHTTAIYECGSNEPRIVRSN